MQQQLNALRTERERRGRGKESDGFSLKQIPGAFASLPRVLRLVWSTSPLMTTTLALLSLLQGFTPAASVWLTKLVVDGVVKGIQVHSTAPIWGPVGLQL